MVFPIILNLLWVLAARLSYTLPAPLPIHTHSQEFFSKTKTPLCFCDSCKSPTTPKELQQQQQKRDIELTNYLTASFEMSIDWWIKSDLCYGMPIHHILPYTVEHVSLFLHWHWHKRNQTDRFHGHHLTISLWKNHLWEIVEEVMIMVDDERIQTEHHWKLWFK